MNPQSLWARCLSASVLTLLVTACSPTTRYRQTLFTAPAAPPDRVGMPLAPGQIGVGGSASAYLVGGADPASVGQALFPDVGDPGLMLPVTSLGGHARVGVVEHLEIGVSGLYAAPSQAATTSIGVLPLHDPQPLLGLMPQVTVGGAIDELVGFGATIEAGRTFMPYTRYQLDDRDDVGQLVAGSGEELYSARSGGVTGRWQFRYTNVLTLSPGIVEASAGGTLTHQITNVGFSNQPQPISRRGPLVVMPVAQVGLALPSLNVGLQGWWAVGALEATDSAYKGPGARVVAEVVLGSPRRDDEG